MHSEVVAGKPHEVFFWNVDGAVGLNGANKWDDVLFVQWCFHKMATWERIKPDVRKVFAQTPVSGICTGREGDLLVASIQALERMVGGTFDGRVSAAKAGGRYEFHTGEHTFLIFYLNAALREIHPQQYPRIDLMPEFVWRIKDKAIAPFISVPRPT